MVTDWTDREQATREEVVRSQIEAAAARAFGASPSYVSLSNDDAEVVFERDVTWNAGHLFDFCECVGITPDDLTLEYDRGSGCPTCGYMGRLSLSFGLKAQKGE